MKLFPIVLVNIVTVVVALVVYDQLRTEASPATRERASNARSGVADTVALEGRVRALEARGDYASRLDAVEAALRASPAPQEKVPERDARTPAETPRASAPAAIDDEPTKDDVRRFRKLQEAVRRENAVKKNRAHVDRGLGKLSINLTPKQREQVHHAYAAFQPQVDRIWTEVKIRAQETIAAGGEVDRREIVASTQTRIQSEFAAALGSIFGHPADAEAVSEALIGGGK